MTKYFSAITVGSIFLWIMVATDYISLAVFVILFSILSVAMFAVGVVELKKTVQDSEEIKWKATKLKQRLAEKNKTI